MPKRSNRTPTVIERVGEVEENGTVRQLLELFTRGNVPRVTLRHYSKYRSKLLSDRGSQFVVYTGDGVNTFGRGEVVVKCARLKLGSQPLSDNDKNRERATALYKELQILTHPRLRAHPNIPSLLWYDFVESGDSKFIPALVMERATLGSLSAFLGRDKQSLTEACRMHICADVTSGLLALHRAGVIHGDVKTDNALVFHSAQDERYMTQIADFGSAIVVNLDKPSEHMPSWRYYGTPATNAPEVADQTTSKLDTVGLQKCDNYSLGLLILEVVIGHLNSLVEAKSAEVVENAITLLDKANLSEQGRADISHALRKLLAYDSKDRCGDLSVIDYLFRPLPLENLTIGIMSSAEGNPRGSPHSRDDEDLATASSKTFGLNDYLNIYVDIELESERDTQELILGRLIKESKSQEKAISAKALFQLAIASSCGFGTPYSEDEALQYTILSARKGYLPAMAVAFAFHLALRRQDELDIEEQTDWLFEATAWGSYIAASCLRKISPPEFEEARKEFYKAGGFNQFFYA